MAADGSFVLSTLGRWVGILVAGTVPNARSRTRPRVCRVIPGTPIKGGIYDVNSGKITWLD